MAYTVINGWNLVPRPVTPAFRSVQFHVTDAVGKTQSPFTLQTQFQAWPGADNWAVDVTLPPMRDPQFRPWRAWFMALRGETNVFQLGDPWGQTPLGTPAGAPVMDGAALACSTTINTRGWTANATNVLGPGDYIQIGYYLHCVAGVTYVSANSSGKATIEIWPSLRENPPDGLGLILNNTAGLFRLASNTRDWSVQENRLVGFTFKAIEAR